jgi:16S rRNA (guanine527-N7)-methyltransferase
VERDREPLPSRIDGLPDLPDTALAVLEAGLPALDLGELPPAVRAMLEGHLRLMLAWNAAMNLTAIREPGAAACLHILDSLAAVPLLRARGVDALIDLGSGGGYPGLPIAVALPARRALLVDSIAKKARFIATAASALGLEERVEAFAGRSEALAADRRHRERWPAVVTRAVAALPELAELGLPLLARGGVLVAWKRRPIDVELAAAAPAVDALGGGRVELIDVHVPGLEDHVLVVIEKVRPTPAGYPRDPAARKQRPW